MMTPVPQRFLCILILTCPSMAGLLLSPRSSLGQDYIVPDFDCEATREQARRLTAAWKVDNGWRISANDWGWTVDDSVMIPVAGVPYDRIDEEDRRELGEEVRRCMAGEPGEFAEAGSLLRRMLQARYHYVDRLLQALELRRAAWERVAELRGALRTGPPSEDMKSYWKRSTPFYKRLFWPDVVAEIDSLFADAEQAEHVANRTRYLREQVNVRALDRAPDDLGAVIPTLLFVRVLNGEESSSSWYDMYGPAVEQAEPAVVDSLRQELEADFETRYERLLIRARNAFNSDLATPDAVEEASRVASVLGGLEEDGWTTPRQEELISLYHLTQPDRIAGAEAALIADVREAPSARAVERYASLKFRMSRDRDVPAARRVLAWATRRSAAFELAAVLGWSEVEQRRFERTGHVPSAEGPTDVDVYFALEEFLHRSVNLPYEIWQGLTDWMTKDDDSFRVWPSRVRLQGCSRQSDEMVACQVVYSIDTNARDFQEQNDLTALLMAIQRMMSRAGTAETRIFAFQQGRWVIVE